MLMTVHICQIIILFSSSSAKEFDCFLTEDCMTLDNKRILHMDWKQEPIFNERNLLISYIDFSLFLLCFPHSHLL